MRADRGGGVAVARVATGGSRGARRRRRRRGGPRRPGAPGSRDGAARVLAAGLRLGPAPNLRGGGRGRGPGPTAVPGKCGACRGTPRDDGKRRRGRRRRASRRDARALGSPSDGSITVPDHAGSSARVASRPRAGPPRARARGVRRIRRGRSRPDVLRHGRRAKPPPRGAQTGERPADANISILSMSLGELSISVTSRSITSWAGARHRHFWARSSPLLERKASRAEVRPRMLLGARRRLERHVRWRRRRRPRARPRRPLSLDRRVSLAGAVLVLAGVRPRRRRARTPPPRARTAAAPRSSAPSPSPTLPRTPRPRAATKQQRPRALVRGRAPIFPGRRWTSSDDALRSRARRRASLDRLQRLVNRKTAPVAGGGSPSRPRRRPRSRRRRRCLPRRFTAARSVPSNLSSRPSMPFARRPRGHDRQPTRSPRAARPTRSPPSRRRIEIRPRHLPGSGPAALSYRRDPPRPRRGRRGKRLTTLTTNTTSTPSCATRTSPARR